MENKTIDLTEKVDIQIHAHEFINHITKMIVINMIDKSALRALTQHEVILMTTSVISKFLYHINDLWANDLDFRRNLGCTLISETDLYKLAPLDQMMH